MKRFILLFLFAVISTATFATDPIKFGVTGGANSSNTTVNAVSNFGYNVGIVFEAPIITNKVLLCPSLQYSTRVYNFYKPQFSTVYEKNRFSYIDVPLMIKLKTNSIGDIKLFTSFGPTFSYLFQITSNDNKVDHSAMFGDASKYNLRKYSWSLGINFGAELSKKYQISIGYNFGLNDLSYNYMRRFAKGRSIMLTLTYLL